VNIVCSKINSALVTSVVRFANPWSLELELDIDAVVDWCFNNEMNLNIPKCNIFQP